MKVWKLDADMSEYESFKLKKEDKAFLRNFKKEMSNGEKKKGKFDNLEIEIIDSGKSSDLPQFWNFTGVLIFSERAKKCLESYLEDWGAVTAFTAYVDDILKFFEENKDDVVNNKKWA